MVFRKDESNNNNFHSSFRPVKISESICLFLLKKADIFFGVATFPETFKGTPSAFLFSVTNEKCIYKSQDGYSQAFTYELNSIIFGKNEIKIKSGYKNVTIQEIIYKGYFENYVKSEVFGPEFKEVSEFDSFEIHKVHVWFIIAINNYQAIVLARTSASLITRFMIPPKKSNIADFMKNLLYYLAESSFLMSMFRFSLLLSLQSISRLSFLNWMKDIPLMWR